MMKFMLYALSTASLGLVGCASITNDVTHPMKVETLTSDGQALVGAECKFTNDFTTSTGKSGGTLPVRRSSKDLDINCALPGQPDANGRAISRANAGMAGNIIFGGGIGAIIDHNKGTAYTYPTWVQLVFGQMRIFDRKDEKEGQVVAGTVSTGAAVAAGAAGRAVGNKAASAPAAVVVTTTSSGAPIATLATGYARVDDVDAVPYLSDRGRERYREWLTKSTPRAFAIAPNGNFSFSNGLKPLEEGLPTDPSERALITCERFAKIPCKLYAVNGVVVWTKAP